ncbi:MAG: HD-GYP domain-containing protein [Gemmatimonadota bacterium]
MSIKPVHIYVGIVVLAALVALGLQDWQGFMSLPRDVLVAIAFLTALGLFSEASAIRLDLARGTATSSATFLPLLACVTLFGPMASVVFFGVNGIAAEFLIRKKDALKAAFNSAQYVLSTVVAGWVYTSLGGYPVVVEAQFDPGVGFDAHFLAFAGFGVTFLCVNNALVFLAISLSSSARPWGVFTNLVRRQAPALLYDLFISPLGLLIALLYFHLGLLGFAIGLFPLVFVRHSYLAKYRLERANRDLLKALVMAIETRDKYTSGHSLRVQRLSERIGRMLSLSNRHLDELSTAALLHDVGKVEVGYEEILQKPGQLTDVEKATIQSHVMRGVDILTALSSVNPRVIDAVKHHHEAWDGSGYPNGTMGPDIPLLARIIAISDAVDAMLSDRPYRKALSVASVEEQLRLFAGRQFDPDLAARVLKADIVREHLQEVSFSQSLRAVDADSPAVRLPPEGLIGSTRGAR